jgi:HEAT repeat protein
VVHPLRAGLRDLDPRVREASLSALACCRAAQADLVRAARGEESQRAAAAALRALGAQRSPAAFELLAAALGRESHGDRIRIAALQGLGVLADPRGIPVALAQATPGRSSKTRIAAIRALRDLGEGQRVVSRRLVDLLGDDDFRVRQAAAQALGTLNEPRARGRLREALGLEPVPSARREMEKAIRRIETR